MFMEHAKSNNYTMKNKKYLLDTNILIEFIHGNKLVINRMLQAGLENCCMSVISLHELYYGAYNAKRKKTEYFEQEMTRINLLLQKFAVLPLPIKADQYGIIKTQLLKIGKPIDEFDMIIGGQALDAGLVVVTDNLKHFENIPSLNVENWTAR